MPKPIELLPGFAPTRVEEQLPDGDWKITVTPPLWSGFTSSSLTLNPDQYRRYKRWQDENLMIQDALADLSLSQREILLTGIGPEEFDEAFRDDE